MAGEPALSIERTTNERSAIRFDSGTGRPIHYGAIMSFLKIRASFLSAAVFALGIVGVVLWQSPLFGAEVPA
jgi:hypothetical protein